VSKGKADDAEEPSQLEEDSNSDGHDEDDKGRNDPSFIPSILSIPVNSPA
jgi:hypothetical protein